MTTFIRTLHSVPSVSVLERFNGTINARKLRRQLSRKMIINVMTIYVPAWYDHLQPHSNKTLKTLSHFFDHLKTSLIQTTIYIYTFFLYSSFCHLRLQIARVRGGRRISMAHYAWFQRIRYCFRNKIKCMQRKMKRKNGTFFRPLRKAEAFPVGCSCAGTPLSNT